MTNLAHITETALLLLAAYLLGCSLGYAIRLALHAGRGTRQVVAPLAAAAAAAAPSPEPRKPRSSAARLAASVDTTPLAPTVAPGPAVVEPPPVPSNPVKIAEVAQKPASAATVAQPRPKPSGKPGPKPATLDQPRSGAPDNLKQIKGIGPKIEASLYAMGIFHIDQIAGWNKANVEWVDAQLSFKGRIRRERWVEQALELGTAKAGAGSAAVG